MNISISEIIVILLIALLVIKPEQLPEVFHALGNMFKLMQSFFKKIKTEFSAMFDDAKINESNPKK